MAKAPEIHEDRTGLQLNAQEQANLLHALDLAAKSSKRAMNTGRSPALRGIYADEIRAYEDLIRRVHSIVPIA